MAKKSKFNYQDVIRFLTSNSGLFTYGQLASELGFDYKRNSRAVGRAMNPICSEGLHELCVRVTDQNRQHHCKVK